MKRIKDSIIIGNCCDSTYIKKTYIGEKLDHPWYSGGMMANDYIKFIKEFNEIDFTKYKKLSYNESKISNYKHIYSWDGHNRELGIKTKDAITIEYDNGIQIIYPHFVNWNKFDEKYSRRLKRFNNINKDDIIFTIRVFSDYTDEIINEFYNLNVNKIIIFPSNHNLKDKYKDNEFDYVILNPPFDLWDKFIEKAKKIADTVIAIGKTDYFSCYQRLQNGIWDTLSDVYIFNRKVDYQFPIFESGEFGVGSLTSGWFVWKKGYTESPRLHFIDVQKYAKLGNYETWLKKQNKRVENIRQEENIFDIFN